MKGYDLIILGGGAAGLMCAVALQQAFQQDVHALPYTKRPLNIAIIEGNPEVGAKLLVCGGGKGNLSNLSVDKSNYLSRNPYFPISALTNYSQYDAMEFFESLGVTWDEREQGRLYTHQGTKEVLQRIDRMLRRGYHRVDRITGATIQRVSREKNCSQPLYRVETSTGSFAAPRVVVATGGVSFRNLGATDIGYTIAKHFGHKIIPPRPALSPMVLKEWEQGQCNRLAGISLEVELLVHGQTFTGSLLFTHFGISGLVVLQSSLYWEPGERIRINLLPGRSLEELLTEAVAEDGSRRLGSLLREFFPKRLVRELLHEISEKGVVKSNPKLEASLEETRLAELPGTLRHALVERIHQWEITPQGLRGFSIAEVTSGGVDTQEISSKTMESKRARDLYFIGEVLDVTGELGGYNLQWAWSSGVAAARGILGKYLE